MLPYILIGIGALIVREIIKSTRDPNKDLHGRRIFISHSWKRASEEYDKFIEKLKQENIEFFDHSIPEDKAVDAEGKKELREIFRAKMRNCNKVFVLAASGTKEDSFVGIELEIATELNKEIIAVKPHGQVGLPAFIKKRASKIIANNSTSILNSLKIK